MKTHFAGKTLRGDKELPSWPQNGTEGTREGGPWESGPQLCHQARLGLSWVGGVIVLFSSSLCCSSSSVSCSILNIINDFIAFCLSLPILHSFHRTKFKTFFYLFLKS